MADIVISNQSRYVTLNKVIAYIISKQINYPNYDVPSKVTPTVDTDAFSVKPTNYRITAKIPDEDKEILENMRYESDQPFLIDDAENTARNVRLESMEFSNNPGFADVDKWDVTITLTATDH